MGKHTVEKNGSAEKRMARLEKRLETAQLRLESSQRRLENLDAKLDEIVDSPLIKEIRRRAEDARVIDELIKKDPKIAWQILDGSYLRPPF